MWAPLEFLAYLGLQVKWNQFSSNNSHHTSCIHKGLHAGKWPDLMTSKPDSVSIGIPLGRPHWKTTGAASALGCHWDHTGWCQHPVVFQWRSSVNLHNWNTLEHHWGATGRPLEAHWKHACYQQFFLQWHSSEHWGLISRHTGLPLDCHWITTGSGKGDCVDVWCEAVVPLTAGCVKLKLPASSSRLCHNGNRVPVAVLTPVLLRFVVIMLKPAAHTSRNQPHMFMGMGDSIQMILTETNNSPSFNWLHNFTCLTTCPLLSGHDGMCKATTPVVKEICMTSQWRQEGDVSRFGRDFERICRINDSYKVVWSCYNRDWSRLTGSYVNNTLVICCPVVTSRERCTSLRRTTNHEGVVDITPDQPWPIPSVTHEAVHVAIHVS